MNTARRVVRRARRASWVSYYEEKETYEDLLFWIMQAFLAEVRGDSFPICSCTLTTVAEIKAAFAAMEMPVETSEEDYRSTVVAAAYARALPKDRLVACIAVLARDPTNCRIAALMKRARSGRPKPMGITARESAALCAAYFECVGFDFARRTLVNSWRLNSQSIGHATPARLLAGVLANAMPKDIARAVSVESPRWGTTPSNYSRFASMYDPASALAEAAPEVIEALGELLSSRRTP